MRYAETDQMGIVYHANYIVWFEVGRVDFVRQLGLDYKLMEKEDGVGIAVVEAVARFRAPARFDDELIVRTTLAHLRGSLLTFDYQIVRADIQPARTLLCEGSTTHIVVDRAMKRSPMPERFAELFRNVVVQKPQPVT